MTEEGEDVLWFENFQPLVKRVFMGEWNSEWREGFFIEYKMLLFSFSVIHSIVKWEWFNSIICESIRSSLDVLHNYIFHTDIVIIVNMVFLVLYTAFITGQSTADTFLSPSLTH